MSTAATHPEDVARENMVIELGRLKLAMYTERVTIPDPPEGFIEHALQLAEEAGIDPSDAYLYVPEGIPLVDIVRATSRRDGNSIHGIKDGTVTTSMWAATMERTDLMHAIPSMRHLDALIRRTNLNEEEQQLALTHLLAWAMVDPLGALEPSHELRLTPKMSVVLDKNSGRTYFVRPL